MVEIAPACIPWLARQWNWTRFSSPRRESTLLWFAFKLFSSYFFLLTSSTFSCLFFSSLTHHHTLYDTSPSGKTIFD